jgi:hypothetical protein
VKFNVESEESEGCDSSMSELEQEDTMIVNDDTVKGTPKASELTDYLQAIQSCNVLALKEQTQHSNNKQSLATYIAGLSEQELENHIFKLRD